MDILSSKILSKNIKKYRKKIGLTQKQLSQKSSVPFSTYLKIESGYTPNPSIQAVANIAKALKVSVDHLISKK